MRAEYSILRRRMQRTVMSLDRLDQVPLVAGELLQFGLGGNEGGGLLALQFIPEARVLDTELFTEGRVHQARAERIEHESFQFILADGQNAPILYLTRWRLTVGALMAPNPSGP